MNDYRPKCIRFNPPESLKEAMTVLAVVNVDPEKDQSTATKLIRMGFEYKPSHIKGQKKPGWVKRLPAGLCLNEEQSLKKQLNIETEVYQGK